MLKLNLPNSFHSPRKRKPVKRDFIFENKERIRLMTLNHFRLQHAKEPRGWREKYNTRLEDLVFRLTSSNTRLPVHSSEIIKDNRYRLPKQKRRRKRTKSLSSRLTIESKSRRSVANKSSTDFLRKFMNNVNHKNEEHARQLKRRTQMEEAYGGVAKTPRKKKRSKDKQIRDAKLANGQKSGTSIKIKAPIVEDDKKNVEPIIPVASVVSSFKEIGCQYSEYDREGNSKVCYPSKYPNLLVNTDNTKNTIPEMEKNNANDVTARKSYNDIIFKRKGESASPPNAAPKRGSRSKSSNAKKQQIIVSSRYNKSKNKLTRTFNNDWIGQDTRPPPAEPFPDVHKQKKSDLPGGGKEKKKRSKPPGFVLPEKERLNTLKMLQAEYYRVLRELRRLPVKNETFQVKIKKIRLEEDLQGLEKNIKSFSCSRVIIVQDRN